MRRARVVLIVSTLALLFVLVAGAVALAGGNGTERRYTYGIAVDRLPDRQPVGVTVRLPGPDGPPGRVIFVRRDREVRAFIAWDTRTGCEVLIPGDRDYAALVSAAPRGFDPWLGDNCGGSRWTLDGTCLGGPCARDLDEYPVEVEAGRAVIDIRNRIPGASAVNHTALPDSCTFDNPAAAVVGPPVLPTCS